MQGSRAINLEGSEMQGLIDTSDTSSYYSAPAILLFATSSNFEAKTEMFTRTLAAGAFPCKYKNRDTTVESVMS